MRQSHALHTLLCTSMRLRPTLAPCCRRPSTVPKPHCLLALPRQPPGTSQMRAARRAPATRGHRPPAPARMQQGREAVTHTRLAGRLEARPTRAPASGCACRAVLAQHSTCTLRRLDDCMACGALSSGAADALPTTPVVGLLVSSSAWASGSDLCSNRQHTELHTPSKNHSMMMT
jgi:hypothetical protein